MELSVIIANYNGRQWLPACLTSLAAQTKGLAHEVIVVDNASQDDGVAWLRRAFPAVKLILNEANVGFAAANNQGIEQAQGRYILLLNNDTIFETGLPEMISFLEEHPDCGAVGPQMLNGRGEPRGSWGYFPTLGRLAATMLMVDRLPILNRRFPALLVRPSRAAFFKPAHPVDWASAACLLVKREVFERVGLLDTHYFMYGEEVEWCYRARQAGYRVWVLPSARLVHFGAGGQEWRDWKGPAATRNSFANFLYFHQKHSPGWQQILLRLALLAGACLRLLAGVALYAIERGGGRQSAARVIEAYARLIPMLARLT
ncbi:MAG: glycosyltransferase family 2 protein [Anaerolineae bacterium]